MSRIENKSVIPPERNKFPRSLRPAPIYRGEAISRSQRFPRPYLARNDIAKGFCSSIPSSGFQSVLVGGQKFDRLLYPIILIF